MKTVIVHTLPPAVVPAGRLAEEFDLSEAAAAVAEVLPDAVVAAIAGRPDEFLEVIRAHAPAVVFNLCEAPLGRPALEAHAAALWEWLGVRFTGARPTTLALCRTKDRVNALLAAAGVAVPASGVFPCLVKPADEDGSAWIGRDSVCRDEAAVRQAVARLPGRALVEEFVPGREFAVSAWGAECAEFFSVGETVLANGLELITYAAKWLPESPDYRDSPVSYETEIEAALRAALIDSTRRVWDAVGGRGYLRVDLRLNAAGEPRVLDVNPNPALGASGGIRAATAAAGWDWARFVRAQVEWSC